jgi:cell shape-determining protein MreC
MFLIAIYVVFSSLIFFSIIHHVFVRLKILDTVGLTERQRKTLYYTMGEIKKRRKEKNINERIRNELNDTIQTENSIDEVRSIQKN